MSRVESARFRRSFLLSVLVHVGVVGVVWALSARGPELPQMRVYAVNIVSPPPQADGTIRVIEIAGLDRQACGGTHLSSTGQSPPVRILKVDNKGRHNRRIRIGLAG